MKISLEKYLLNSSVFIIFSEAFFVNFIIDWKLMYLIMFTNYWLLFKYYGIKAPKTFLYFVGLILIHAIICYSIIQIPPNFFLSQILGVFITGVYFYNVLKVLPLDKVKKTYLNFAFYAAVIGYIFYFTGFNYLAYFTTEHRLISVFKEPAHYVIVVIPACYYFLKTKHFFKFLTILVSILLSTSSLGYIGIGLMFFIPFLNLKKILYFVFSIPFLIACFVFTYNNVEQFQMRVDDSLENLIVLKNGKFEEHTNLSSYVLLSNLYIAKNNFVEHPLGSGIGSHHYMYTTEYYQLMRPPEYLITLGHNKDNSFDANSLFTRLFSEFGLIGLFCIIIALFYIFKCFKTNNYLLHGIVIYFLLKLFRDGTYFPPELFFFVWLLVFEVKKIENE